MDLELGQLGVNEPEPLKKLVAGILSCAAESATTVELRGVEQVTSHSDSPQIPDWVTETYQKLKIVPPTPDQVRTRVQKNTPSPLLRKLRPKLAKMMDETRVGLLDTYHEPARFLNVTFDGAEAMVCPASLTRGVFRVLARALGFEPEAWDCEPIDFSFTRVDRSTIWRLIGFRFDNDPYAKIVRVETGP